MDDVDALIRLRRQRLAHFPPEVATEPAWNMVLALMLAHRGGYRMSVTDLCDASDIAPTTALRYVGRLKDLGIIVRTPHPTDGRVMNLHLSADALLAMSRYLGDLRLILAELETANG
jgi:DNA-binding MarR family transcriptional regulator